MIIKLIRRSSIDLFSVLLYTVKIIFNSKISCVTDVTKYTASAVYEMANGQ